MKEHSACLRYVNGVEQMEGKRKKKKKKKPGGISNTNARDVHLHTVMFLLLRLWRREERQSERL